MEQKIRRDRNMGDNLRKLRLEKKISQEKLCAELQRRGCDIGRTTYAKYESGELNIRASVLIELRKIYGCSYDAFFEGLEQEAEFQSIGEFAMSFIYAAKVPYDVFGHERENVQIFSETMIRMDSSGGSEPQNWLSATAWLRA